MRNCGSIDPMYLDETVARGTYRGAFHALAQMSADEVIDEVLKSGLRGRGGAAFPTGQKWRLARQAAADVKYVVCNADEGEPGAYMDRSVLEGDPHADHRGNANRFLRDRRKPRADIRPRRISPGHGNSPARHCRGRASRYCWATIFSAADGRSTSRCTAGPGLTSAAKKPRLSNRSKAIRANRARARPIRSPTACGESPPW